MESVINRKSNVEITSLTQLQEQQRTVDSILSNYDQETEEKDAIEDTEEKEVAGEL